MGTVAGKCETKLTYLTPTGLIDSHCKGAPNARPTSSKRHVQEHHAMRRRGYIRDRSFSCRLTALRPLRSFTREQSAGRKYNRQRAVPLARWHPDAAAHATGTAERSSLKRFYVQGDGHSMYCSANLLP